MATVTASDNIKNISYIAGEQITLNNSVNPFVRLTIDAQDAADVAKIEGTAPGVISMDSVNTELYVVNTSTTTPLIVKINGERNHPITSATFKVRGNWISIGTGTGLDNQTVPVASVGGKLIDWPPFVQVETAAGSGVYVDMLNIGGNYKDGYSGSGLTPTTYPFPATFSQVGKTRDNGHFFEFDEENSSIKFGSAAVGGWIPPNGANIRIPNIHFTGTSRPSATAGARNRITTAGGVFDFEVCSFSNRWGLFGVQFWPYSLRIRNVGFVRGGTTCSNVNGPIDIDGVCTPVDLYQNNLQGLVFASCNGPFSLNNMTSVGRGTLALFRYILNPVAIGTIRSTVLAKTSAFSYAIQMEEVIAQDEAPITIGPFYVNGGPLRAAGNRNLDVNGIYFSDTATGVASATNTCSIFSQSGSNYNCTFRKWRLLNGGCPSNSNLADAQQSYSNNVAYHDIDFNGQNPSTLANWQTGFNTLNGRRTWFANINVTNMASSIFPAGGSAIGSVFPCRASNLNGGNAALQVMSGMMVEHAPASTVAVTASSVDWSPALLTRTKGASVGVLTLFGGAKNLNSSQVEVNSGVEGTDFYRIGTLYFPANGVQLTYTPYWPIRGVTGAASCSIAFAGASATSGVTYEFRLRNAGDDTWPAWATLSASNFASAFSALSGYSSAVGFEISFRITSTTAVSGRTSASIAISALDIDSTFAPSEVGFIQIGYTGAVSGASVAVIDTSGSPVVRGYTASASGDYKFEYPYDFDGTSVPFRMVARKAGYSEIIVDTSCYQAGKSVPVTQVAAHPVAADASVADISINGVTEVMTVTASKTLAQLYQMAQWWAHQRANMIYDTPLTSNDGNTFTIPTGWELAGASYLTGGTVAGGTITGITAGTLNIGFDGSTIEIGAAGTYTLDAGNCTIVATPTGASDYDLSGGTFSGSNLFWNTSAHNINVSIPSGAVFSSAGSPGSGTVTFIAPIISSDISITGMTTAAGAARRLQIFNATAAAASTRANSTAYAAGAVRLRQTGVGTENTAGLYLRCTTAGTSAGSPPTWNTTPGGTTTDGTVVWTTYSILYYDADPSSATFADTYIDGEEFLAGETVTIRFAEADADVSFKSYSTNVIVGASGFSALVAPVSDAVYAENALDGADYESTYSPNFTSNYIVLDTNTDFAGKSAYAYFCYTLTTSNGMYRFWGGVTALDSGNYRINTDILNLYFDESAGFVKQTDNVRIFRSDGTRPAIDPTTGGHGIELNWRVPVNVVSTGGSALTSAESAQLMSLPNASSVATAVWNKTLP